MCLEERSECGKTSYLCFEGAALNKGSSKVRTHPAIFGTIIIFREFLSVPGGQSYVYHIVLAYRVPIPLELMGHFNNYDMLCQTCVLDTSWARKEER